MRKLITIFVAAILFIGTFVLSGFISNREKTSDTLAIIEEESSDNLILRHSNDIFSEGEVLMSGHTSHASHSSHASHASHASHSSHSSGY